MRIAYFDCFSGASGDMILGALISAGWPAAALEATLAQLGASDYRLIVSPVVKQGLAAVAVSFDLPDQPAERRLGELLDMVAGSALPEATKSDALRVLRRLGEAEARVHGANTTLEDLRFHELGSLDTVFDVVGTVAGLTALGVSAVSVSPLNLGGGCVQTAHGLLPVPAPAVAELVRGLPVFGGTAADGELLTPTAAALLSTLGTAFGPLPPLTVDCIGCGAGHKEGRAPNVLRLWLGDVPHAHAVDQVHLIETNIDDMNPEFYGPLMDQLFAAGALDVYLTPVIMKKSRPGVVLGVLCAPEQSAALGDILFAETTTLGIRSSTLTRRKLDRNDVVVNTSYGPIRLKVGRRHGQIMTIAPEFEDCRRAATAHRVPLKAVYEATQRAFHEQHGRDRP